VKQRTVFFLLIPLIVILIALYQMNQLNRQRVRDEFERISIAEGVTIHDLAEVAGNRMLQEGEAELTSFLDSLYQNETIVYIGLFKENELRYLLSRYEGFFPVVPGRNPENTRIIQTAMGRIFEIKGDFTDRADTGYHLYIGFDYQFLNNIEEASSRNVLLIGGLFSLLMLFIIVLIVVFDRKFYRKELELLKTTQEKDRFMELSLLTSEIAHEIKNPLNSIYLSFGALEPYLEPSGDAVFYKEAIKGEIKRITNIINSYSDLSKEVEPHIATIRLRDWTEGFQLLLDGELNEKQVSLTIHLNGGDTFKTDGDILKHILFNLVRNAMEAQATNITLRFDVSAGQLTIVATDNGKGIDKAVEDRLFKPYVTTKAKGMGLGLHVTLKQLKALDGSIELIDGNPGATAFKLTIPQGRQS